MKAFSQAFNKVHKQNLKKWLRTLTPISKDTEEIKNTGICLGGV